MKKKLLKLLMNVMLCTVLIFSIPNMTYAETVDASYPEWRPDAPVPERPHLTKSAGVFQGPSGKETYYNLPMGRCINIMRDMGYSVEEYPYWVREDGAKMLGNYVMCAANLSIRPKGTIVESSLGQAIVVDTGGFASSNTTQLDLCTDW